MVAPVEVELGAPGQTFVQVYTATAWCVIAFIFAWHLWDMYHKRTKRRAIQWQLVITSCSVYVFDLLTVGITWSNELFFEKNCQWVMTLGLVGYLSAKVSLWFMLLFHVHKSRSTHSVCSGNGVVCAAGTLGVVWAAILAVLIYMAPRYSVLSTSPWTNGQVCTITVSAAEHLALIYVPTVAMDLSASLGLLYAFGAPLYRSLMTSHEMQERTDMDTDWEIAVDDEESSCDEGESGSGSSSQISVEPGLSPRATGSGLQSPRDYTPREESHTPSSCYQDPADEPGAEPPGAPAPEVSRTAVSALVRDPPGEPARGAPLCPSDKENEQREAQAEGGGLAPASRPSTQSSDTRGSPAATPKSRRRTSEEGPDDGSEADPAPAKSRLHALAMDHELDTTLCDTPAQRPNKPKKLPSYTVLLKPTREESKSSLASISVSSLRPSRKSSSGTVSRTSTFVSSMNSIRRSQTFGMNTQMDLAGDMVFRVLERNVRLTIWIMAVTILAIGLISIFGGIRQIWICTDMTVTALCVKLFFDQQNKNRFYKIFCLQRICCRECFHAYIYTRIETRRDTFRASQHASLAAVRADLGIEAKADADAEEGAQPGQAENPNPPETEEGEESNTDLGVRRTLT